MGQGCQLPLSVLLLIASPNVLASPWTQGALLDIPQNINLDFRIQGDPNNCNVYYYLKTPLVCGPGMNFNKASNRCDSAENVARLDPSCPEQLQCVLLLEDPPSMWP